MSRTIAAVLALVLGLPFVMLAAIVWAAGVDQGFLTGVLTFTVVGSAVVAMLFEIKRLADT
jgi:uncharacterized membrane protein